ncbi:uncharacterized protein LOC125043251 [Penaeus chinensis]|uniref:uncharacterized protein LOC125043251 n=1 Tax=Penaeus chinensis TaxID=139456 RepID=UPI001FB6A73A|nr:uncharacterized protein LOC125043251 [Penaeus chinensis]
MFARTALSARNVCRAKPMGRSMGSVAEYKPPTMSEMPVPQGSWSEANSKKQRMNNLQLLVGVAFAAGTIAAAKNSGLIEFGWGPKIGN